MLFNGKNVNRYVLSISFPAVSWGLCGASILYKLLKAFP